MGKRELAKDVAVITVGSICWTLLMVIVTSAGVFTPEFVRVYNVTRFEAAWAGSLNNGFIYISSLGVVSVIEKLGFFLPMFGAGLCATLSIMMATIARELWLTYLLFSLVGISASFILNGSTAFISLHFDKKRQLAFTVISIVTGASSFLSSFVVSWAVSEHGYQGVLYVFAILTVPTTISTLAFKFIIPRFEANRLSKNEEKAVSVETKSGLSTAQSEVKGYSNDSAFQVINIFHVIQPEVETCPVNENYVCRVNTPSAVMNCTPANVDSLKADVTNKVRDDCFLGKALTYKQIICDGRSVLFVLANFFIHGTMHALIILSQDVATDVFEVSKEKASYFLIFLSAGNLFGRCSSVASAFVPRMHRPAVLVSVYAIYSLAAASIPHTDFNTASVFIFLLGAVFGYTVAVFAVVNVDLFGDKNITRYIGINFSAAGLGAIVTPPLTGLIRDSYSYSEAYLFAGVWLAVGSALYALLLLHPVSRCMRKLQLKKLSEASQ